MGLGSAFLPASKFVAVADTFGNSGFLPASRVVTVADTFDGMRVEGSVGLYGMDRVFTGKFGFAASFEALLDLAEATARPTSVRLTETDNFGVCATCNRCGISVAVYQQKYGAQTFISTTTTRCFVSLSSMILCLTSSSFTIGTKFATG